MLERKRWKNDRIWRIVVWRRGGSSRVYGVRNDFKLGGFCMLFSSIASLLAFSGTAEAFLVGVCVPVATYGAIRGKK